MPLVKVQVATAADTVFARDRIVNTFHLNKEGGPFTGSDWDGLASDTADLFATIYSGTREIDVRIYDTAGAPPHFPLGSHIKNPGGAPATTGPREVACCLSYYGERNLPSTRGRMFICAPAAGFELALRPSVGNRGVLIGLANGIAGLGGLDVDWQVYSPTHDSHENVQHAYVDDEWDTMRSRGLRATTRSTAAISE